MKPRMPFILPQPFKPGVAHNPNPLMPSVELAPAAPSAKVQEMLKRPVESFAPQDTSSQEPMTYAALVLDESGSMLRHKASALEGFNAQVGVIREGAKEAGRTAVSLTTFNSLGKPALVARPVEELRPLTPAEYNPNGGTALFDAIGETLERLLERSDINSPNTAVLVAIFTDGEENASRRYSAETLKELIIRLEATGRWTFTLMGPEGTSQELASLLNLHKGNVSQFNPADAASTQAAFGTMTEAATRYMSMRSMGVTACASLYAGGDHVEP